MGNSSRGKLADVFFACIGNRIHTSLADDELYYLKPSPTPIENSKDSTARGATTDSVGFEVSD